MCCFLADSLSTLAWIFSRRLRRSRRRMQRGCIISQRKTVCLRLKLFCCFRFCLRKSAGSAGESAVSFVLIDWVLLCEYSPADYADHADECSRLHYIAEKDWLFEVKAVIAVLGFCCFGFRLRKSARSAGDFGVSFVLIDWVRLRLFSRRLRRSRRGMQQSCIISQRKTGCLRLLQLLLFCCFGVLSA